MDRRQFLEQMAIAASLAATSPVMRGAVSDLGGESDAGSESPPSSPTASGQIGRSLNPQQRELADGFARPPRSAAPWVYWMWLNVDTTPAAMTFDLEQMKATGIQGFILYNTPSGGVPRNMPRMILVDKNGHFEYQFVETGQYTGCYTTPIPFPSLEAWTPLWRERIRYVAKEAARLDLKFCLAMGLSGTSGHIAEEYGNQKLVWTETRTSGPAKFDGALPDAELAQGPNHRPVTADASEKRYFRDIAVMAIPDSPGFPVRDVIDLTAKMNATGHLTWDTPAGSWKILRFFQVPTGARNGYGYYSDAMSSEALDQTWAVTMAPLLKEMSPEERRGIIGIEDDSWEGGEFTWTRKFPEEFRRRRGYDLAPYLPLLAGADMADTTTRERFQRDYKLTISDLMADYHYGHLEKLCKANGLMFYSEAAGPNLHTADLLQNTSRVDIPMAEFWMPSYHRPTPKSQLFSRNGACASHIYGMPLNMDEAFTSMGPEWEETPFSMKPVSDQAFCEGVNRICVHNFSHSPSMTAKPGYVYMPGTHYEPRITWWEQTPAFNQYLARCSFLLQQGKFVADAIFYKGDDLGDGEPTKIFHPTLGDGFDYDCSNTDVLLTRMSVKNGRIVLPDGMSYRVLILPDNQPMAFDALQKVRDLIEAGATVVGPPPTGLAGLPLRPDEEGRFEAQVAHLWGTDRSNAGPVKRRIGAGYLVSGQSARQTLLDAGVPPDFEHTGLSDDGTIYWIHRRLDDADIYYVASYWQPVEKLECTFRVSGKRPELWDPVTGAMRDAGSFRQEGGRTIVPLEFDPCGSTFVVFRKSIATNAIGKQATNCPVVDGIQHTLSGPWEVSFDAKWGGPEKVIFDQLVDWTMRPEFGIKYYSGTAIYRKKFDMKIALAKGERLLLDLGELHEVAAVRLNGIDLGVSWTKPARVELSGGLQATGNDLEITVVNLWPNRLIGDEGLPKESRLSETNIHKFNSQTPLLPSGLIGPVRILSVKNV
jgi:hypothetical protein